MSVYGIVIRNTIVMYGTYNECVNTYKSMKRRKPQQEIYMAELAPRTGFRIKQILDDKVGKRGNNLDVSL